MLCASPSAAFVLGCGVSAVASGRFSVLIVDGAVSFAFLPAIELLALRREPMGPRRRRPFPDTTIDS
jgi:hypothetical protein